MNTGVVAWDGDIEELEGHEKELASSPELCDQVFASRHEAFLAGLSLGRSPNLGRERASDAEDSGSDRIAAAPREETNRTTWWVNAYGVIHVEAGNEEQAKDQAHKFALNMIQPDIPGQPRLTLLSCEGKDAGSYGAIARFTDL